MRRFASLLIIVATTAACSSQGADAPAGNPGGESDAGVSSGGGGGVSFGGAQDFGDFQEILTNGGIPGPDTLDANGFFNEHYVPPPASGCANTLCITPGLSVGRDWLTSAHQATLQIAVDTNVDPTQYTRRPLDLVVVIDDSGSMASDGRLDKVKTGLGEMIDGLQDGDRMGIVTFSDSATVVAPLAALDRPALHADVAAVVPTSGTDIYDGLAAGFDLIGAPTAEREARVILLSDGEANEGDTSQADIFAMSDSYIESGIGLTTIGVGSDFDLDLMRGLAEHGAGNFYFLQDDASTTEVFTEELNYFMSPIALDISIAATAGPGYQFGEVLGSTLWTATAASGAMHVPAAFVASRTSVGPGSDGSDGSGAGRRGGGSMVFIALTAAGPFDEAGTVGTIQLTYKLPGGGAPVTQTVTLAYPGDPLATPPTTYLSAPEIAKRYAMYNLFLGLRAATQSAYVDCASVALYATETSAETWNGPHQDADILADIAIIDEYLANLRTVGASADADSAAAACAVDEGDSDGDGDWGDGSGSNDWPVDNQPPPAYGCEDAGAGSSTMLAGLGLAAVTAVRRRRRR